MKKRERLISLLLSAMLVATSLPLTAVPVSAADNGSADSTSAIVALDGTSTDGWSDNVEDVSTDGKTFIHVYNRLNNQTGVKCGVDQVLAKDQMYRMTISLRRSKAIGYPLSGTQKCDTTKVRFYLGGKQMLTADADNKVTINKTNGFGVNVQAYTSKTIELTEAWKTYEIYFTPKEAVNLKTFYMQGQGNGFDMLPFDVADFSVVPYDGVNEVAGAELVKNGVEDFIQYGSDANADTAYFTENGYLTTDTDSVGSAAAEGTKEIAYTFTPAETLAPGVYKISGDFRLTYLDCAKLDYGNSTQGSASIKLGNNKTTITAYTDSVQRGESLEITTEWTNGAFEFEVLSETSVSSLKFTAGANVDIDFDNIKLECVKEYEDDTIDVLDTWKANGAALTLKTDVIDGEVSGYISVVNRKMNLDGVVYSQSEGSLTVGDTYKLSFWARQKPFVKGSKDNVAIRFYGKTGGQITGTGSDNFNTSSQAVLTDNWQKYELTFTAKDANIYLKIQGAGNFFHALPFDIAGLSLRHVGTDGALGDELITGSGLEGWSAFMYNTNANNGYTTNSEVYYVSDTEYLTASAASENTKLHTTDFNAALKPGLYTLTGKFRLNEPIDWSVIESNKLTGKAGGIENASLVKAYPTATITAEAEFGDTVLPLTLTSGNNAVGGAWQELTFELSLSKPMTLTELAFVADGKVALDVDELEWTSEEYIIVDDWYTNGENPLRVISVEDNDYVHVYNRANNLAGAVYKQKNSKLTEGHTYKLEFRARSANETDVPSPDETVDLRIFVGKKYGSSADNNINNITNNLEEKKLVLTSDWDDYEITFDAVKTANNDYTAFEFYIKGWATNGDVLPFDIDDFALYDLDSGNPTKNLITSAERAFSGTSGWAAFDDDSGTHNTKLEIASESNYYHANASGENTVIYSNTEMVLEPGLYSFVGKIRLPKAVLTEENARTANAGAPTTVTASYKGITVTEKAPEGTNVAKELTLIDSSEKVYTVTNEWTEFAFKLNITNPTTLSELKLTAGDAVALDVIDLRLKTVKLYSDNDGINAGILMVLLAKKQQLKEQAEQEASTQMPPVEPETPEVTVPTPKLPSSGNLIEGAMTEYISYWQYGDQTLTAAVDTDGSAVLKTSDIISNTLGYTYVPGYSLRAGSYTVSGEFRTSVAGEKGLLRVRLGSTSKSTALTNEWTKVEFTVVLDKTTPLELKVFGGPIATSVQNYDMRNLTIIDQSDVPLNTNLYANGSFDNEEAALEDVSMGYGKGDVSWNDGHITVANREYNYAPLRITPGITVIGGATYKITYDIRTTNSGETMSARGCANGDAVPLKVDASIATNSGGNVYTVTNEWKTIESYYVPSETQNLVIHIKGGTNPTDNKDFDIDNVKIELVMKGDNAPGLFKRGEFDNENTALTGWKAGYGKATFTWKCDGTDGYITVSDRDLNHTPAQISTGVMAEAGKTYKISYDIRTTNKGEVMTARAYWYFDKKETALKVQSGIATNSGGNEYKVTNEWLTVESTVTAAADGEIALRIKGGQTPGDNKSYDINNLIIEEVGA